MARLLGVRNYLNNNFAYKRLPRSRLRVELASGLLGLKHCLSNYFTMYKRLTPTRICVDLASPAYLVFGIIQIIILSIKV